LILISTSEFTLVESFSSSLGSSGQATSNLAISSVAKPSG